MGVLSPVGNDLDSFWDSLIHGKSGIAPIEAFDTEAYGCRFGGEVRDFDVSAYLKEPKDGKRMDRYAQLAMAASKMALDDSGFDVSSIDRSSSWGCSAFYSPATLPHAWGESFLKS